MTACLLFWVSIQPYGYYQTLKKNTVEIFNLFSNRANLHYVAIFTVSIGTMLALFPQLTWVVFSEDDSHIMRVAYQHSWFAPYFSPEHYRELSVANFTPIPLTVYKVLLSVFGQRPLVFLLIMVLLFGTALSLAGTLVYRLTGRLDLSLIVIALIFASTSTHTLVSRFYTQHYLIGLIFTLAAFLVFVSPGRSVFNKLAIVVLVFLAMLSKEVYLVAPVVLSAIAFTRKDWVLIFGLVTATIIYWLWRTSMLAGGLDMGAESSYFKGVWSLELGQWASFAEWYLRANWLLLIASLIAVCLAPKTYIPMLIAALGFGLPGLTVAHGVASFETHADRIFLAMNVALAISATLAYSKIKFERESLKLPLAVLL